MQTGQLSVGNARRETPPIFRDLRDDLAVEISLAMRRRQITVYGLQSLGYSRERCRDISAWLRGVDRGSFGPFAAVELASKLGIPMRFLSGDEATAA